MTGLGTPNYPKLRELLLNIDSSNGLADRIDLGDSSGLPSNKN